jgi:hypothetical protein
MKMWTPTKSSVVCKKHFTADDYMKTTNTGMSLFSQMKHNVIFILCYC